jgi:putative membrane protein
LVNASSLGAAVTIVTGVAEPTVRETIDATRRTRLANERTYLAWWRTALTAFAVSLAVGKIVPDVAAKGDRWPYALAGAGYALLGVVFLVLGLRRERAVEAALECGIFEPLGRWAVLGLAARGVGLGVLTFVLVVVSP